MTLHRHVAVLHTGKIMIYGTYRIEYDVPARTTSLVYFSVDPFWVVYIYENKLIFDNGDNRSIVLCDNFLVINWSKPPEMTGDMLTIQILIRCNFLSISLAKLEFHTKDLVKISYRVDHNLNKPLLNLVVASSITLFHISGQIYKIYMNDQNEIMLEGINPWSEIGICDHHIWSDMLFCALEDGREFSYDGQDIV